MEHNKLMMMFDGLPAYRLKLYGGPIETPNFEKLSKQSTLYSNVITAAPSTAMSLTSMFTGLFPHEFGRRSYSNVDTGLPDGTQSLFERLEDSGYHTYVLWDRTMETSNPVKLRIDVWQHSDTKFLHYDRRARAGYWEGVKRNFTGSKIKKRKGLTWQLEEVFSNISDLKEPWVLFVRCTLEVSPKFRGASSTNYIEDDAIYEFDTVIQSLSENFPGDTKLYVFSDHGKMYGEQGIWGYAFNLCEGTLRVPLLVYDPNDTEGQIVNDVISLNNLKDIVVGEPLRKTKYLYADTAYADQWHRKTMVRKGSWKYIYHRDGWPCKEQLFDLSTDPNELINLAQTTYTDPYRDSRPKGDTCDHRYSPSGEDLDGRPLNQVIQRGDWEEVLSTLEELREERKRIWLSQDAID